MMSTIIWVIGVFALWVIALSTFGMTIGKKDREDFDDLSRYVDTCEKTHQNKELCWGEFIRLYNRGLIPAGDAEELRVRMIAKFK